jgi:hypothetical protein
MPKENRMSRKMWKRETHPRLRRKPGAYSYSWSTEWRHATGRTFSHRSRQISNVPGYVTWYVRKRFSLFWSNYPEDADQEIRLACVEIEKRTHDPFGQKRLDVFLTKRFRNVSRKYAIYRNDSGHNAPKVQLHSPLQLDKDFTSEITLKFSVELIPSKDCGVAGCKEDGVYLDKKFIRLCRRHYNLMYMRRKRKRARIRIDEGLVPKWVNMFSAVLPTRNRKMWTSFQKCLTAEEYASLWRWAIWEDIPVPKKIIKKLRENIAT